MPARQPGRTCRSHIGEVLVLISAATVQLGIARERRLEKAEELLPSALALDDSSTQTVLAMDAFEERVLAASERHRLLLIFDQFEEIGPARILMHD